MPLGEAFSASSMAMHGYHPALILFGMAGHPLWHAHDPRAAQRDFRRRGIGDPFAETARPLRLGVASDMRWALPDDLRSLMSLSTFPGIEIHAMPGVPDLGFKQVGRVSISGQMPHYLAASTRLPLQSAIYLHASWLADDMPAPRRFGAAGKKLVLDSEAHQALHLDYLVTNFAEDVRRDQRLAPLGRMGMCTLEDAFRLAGAKAAMYRLLPIHASPGFTSSVNVGTWRAHAVMSLAPELQRAIEHALAPSAETWRTTSLGHLAAIRSRLSDLLVARDDAYRLMRRDAMDPEDIARAGRFEENAPLVGPLGNDLLELLAHHAFSALNHAYSIGDNLAWVLLRSAGLSPMPDSVIGLPKVLSLSDKAWRRHERLNEIVSGLKRDMDTDEVLALREIRNYAMHRDGMARGFVTLREETLADLRSSGGMRPGFDDLELPALWVLARDNEHLHARIAPLSDFHSAEVAVISFVSILQRILASTTTMVRLSSAAIRPGDSTWLKKEQGYGDYMAFRRSWERGKYDRLWGFPPCGVRRAEDSRYGH